MKYNQGELKKKDVSLWLGFPIKKQNTVQKYKEKKRFNTN